eukprot:Rhum_TRINITY_DN25537_c0_g1::Rhum_TRINITY_DN25537_c0_g1_i1::g.182254::m.182254
MKFDFDRLSRALKRSGVVAPLRVDTDALVADPHARTAVLSASLLALGSDFLGRDVSPLRGGTSLEARRLAADCLLEMGLVPSTVPVAQKRGLASAGAGAAAPVAEPPTHEDALALVAGPAPDRAAVEAALCALVDVLEAVAYTTDAGLTLEAEHGRCSELEREVLGNGAAVFSKHCAIFPANVPQAEKVQARIATADAPAVGKGGRREPATASSVAALQKQNAALRDGVESLAEKARQAEERRREAVMSPEEMAEKLGHWREAIADLVAVGGAVSTKLAAHPVPAPRASPEEQGRDQLGKIARVVREGASALASLPTTARHVKAAFEDLNLLAEEIDASMPAVANNDSAKWSAQYNTLTCQIPC